MLPQGRELRPAQSHKARAFLFLLRSHRRAIVRAMPEDKLTPADPVDLAWSIAFALRFEGKKRWHDADDMMAAIVADRIVRSLERSGYVVMKKPPSVGGGANPGARSPGR